MKKVYEDLDKLRKKAHENNFILRRDQRVHKLQGEADWFRREAQDLSKECKKLKDKFQPLKDKILHLEQDVAFLRHENDRLKEEKSQLQVALQMSYTNCETLIQVSKHNQHETAHQL